MPERWQRALINKLKPKEKGLGLISKIVK